MKYFRLNQNSLSYPSLSKTPDMSINVAESIITLISTINLAPHGSSNPWFCKAHFYLVLTQEPSGGLAEGAKADVLCSVMLVGVQFDFVIYLECCKSNLMEPWCILD